MMNLFNNTEKGAVFSECKRFRYQLWRIWDESKPLLMFVMLNPSTADHRVDDPTIRRCISFASGWGYGGIYVGNLFSFRATKPSELVSEMGPVIGQHNEYNLKQMEMICHSVVYAWGNSPIIKKMKKRFPTYNPKGIFRPSSVFVIDLSVDGTPKHPLYLKGDLKLKPYKK